MSAENKASLLGSIQADSESSSHYHSSSDDPYQDGLLASDAHDETVQAMENDQVALEIAQPPKDAANIVMFSLFIIGLACFFPSTAILASNDYYEDVWGNTGKQLVFIAPILIQVFTPIIQTLVTKYQERLTYTLRIEGAFVSNTIVAIAFPMQAKMFPSSLSFVIALLLIIAVGAANSILKSTLLSLTASYPPRYTQMLLVGQSASPLAVIILKIFLKKLTPHADSEDERKANTQLFALVFFIISAFVTGSAAAFYKIARRTMFSRHFFPSFKVRYEKYLETKRLHQEYKDRLAVQQFEETNSSHHSENTTPPLPAINSEFNSSQTQFTTAGPDPTKHDLLEKQIVDLPLKVRKLDVFRKMLYWGILLTIQCIPPNATYPALLNSAEPHGQWKKWMHGDWFHLIMLFTYCVVDIGARAVPLNIIHKIFTLDRLPMIILGRYIIYILTILTVYLRSPEISSWAFIIFTIFTSASQAGTYVSILTQYQSVTGLSVAEKNISGSISAIFIAVGVLGGYILSLVVKIVIGKIWGLPT